jgi:hypothetical protein
VAASDTGANFRRRWSVAIVRVDFVKREIGIVSKASREVENRVKEILATVEENPAAYGTLKKDVPPEIAARSDVFIRKVAITNSGQDVRMVYLHRIREDGEEQVDFLYVFFRRDGWNIDWQWIKALLD